MPNKPPEQLPERQQKYNEAWDLYVNMINAHNSATDAHRIFFDKIKMVMFKATTRNTSYVIDMFKKIWERDKDNTRYKKETGAHWSPSDTLTKEAAAALEKMKLKVKPDEKDSFEKLQDAMKVAKDAKKNFIDHFDDKYYTGVDRNPSKRGPKAKQVETMITGDWMDKVRRELGGRRNTWRTYQDRNGLFGNDEDKYLYMNQIPGIRGFIEDEWIGRSKKEKFWGGPSGASGRIFINNDLVNRFFGWYLYNSPCGLTNPLEVEDVRGGRRRRRKSRKSKRKRRRTKKKSKRRRKRTKKKRRRRH